MKDLLCDTDSVLITAVLFVSITISKETPMLTVSFARIRAGQLVAELAHARTARWPGGQRHEQLYVLPGAVERCWST